MESLFEMRRKTISYEARIIGGDNREQKEIFGVGWNDSAYNVMNAISSCASPCISPCWRR